MLNIKPILQTVLAVLQKQGAEVLYRNCPE